MSEQIVSKIVEQFHVFGGGKESPWGNPVAEALKNKPPAFAAGVPVAEVVDFVLRESGHDKAIRLARLVRNYFIGAGPSPTQGELVDLATELIQGEQ